MAGSRSLMARKEMKKRTRAQTAVTRWWSLAAGAEAGREVADEGVGAEVEGAKGGTCKVEEKKEESEFAAGRKIKRKKKKRGIGNSP